MSITAKVKLESKESCSWDPSQVQLHFSPDYNDGRNKEWADATPALSLNMTVKGDVASAFNTGDAFTLTFDKSEE